MKAEKEDLFLKNGSKIAVIGAGPAGVFFADFASQLSHEKGLQLTIVLFDGKDFSQSGASGCNLCAGVISETLVDKLKSRGIVLSEQKVQRKIDGYYLQVRAGGLLLKHPFNEKKITTVFRGNGPRLMGESGNVSFDDYLLEHIRGKGIEIINKSVKEVHLHPDPLKPVEIIYGRGREERSFEADLVVGAFGLNKKMLGIVHDLNFGYKPPETLNALNVEIRLGNDFIQEKLGNIIYIYNWSTVRGMRVAGIIPKKECITVNLIGEMDMKRDDLNEFLNRFEDHNILPKGWKWSDVICRCAPRVAVTPAKKPYTNRLVIVGDASCSRYYKNGIESAFMTARIAAKTAFELGLSEYAFQKGYFQHIRKNLSRDNLYGRILFKINDLVSGSSLFSKVMLKVAEDEGNKANKKPLRSVLWNMYTGNIPYRTILLKFLSPILQWKLSVATAQLISHRLFLLCSRKEKREK